MRFEATVIEYSGIDDQYTNEDYDTFLFDLLKMFYFNNTTSRSSLLLILKILLLITNHGCQS